MIGKLIGARIGSRLAGGNNGTRGALLGMAAPWLLRRAFTPLGLLAVGAYGAKKLYDRRRARRAPVIVEQGAMPALDSEPARAGA